MKLSQKLAAGAALFGAMALAMGLNQNGLLDIFDVIALFLGVGLVLVIVSEPH